MKVLSIGSDKKLFEESPVSLRVMEYAKRVEEYHVIVFTLRGQNYSFRKLGNLHIYPTNSISRLTYVFGAYAIGKKLLLKYATKKDWVISAQDPFETGIPSYSLKRYFGIPLQIQVHTDYLSSNFRNTVLNFIRVLIANFIIKRSNEVRAVSSVIKDSLNNRFPKDKLRIDILPIFVDIDKIMNQVPLRDIKKDFPRFSFIILMASRLTKEKRIGVAIKAMKKIVEYYPNAGLVICGSGPEKNKLQSRAKKYNIDQSVIFAGWQDDLVSYIKTAGIFLLTSEYEGYGMTLIEAGASGCPIVTTRVGIAKTELFKDGINSSVCPVNNYDCLAEKVIEIMGDNQKRELYKRNMKDSIIATSSTKEDYSSKYVSLLSNMLKNEGFN